MNTLIQKLAGNHGRARLRTCLAVALIIVAVSPAALARPLTDAKFVVDPSSYRHWVFEVPDSAHIFGEFSSEGSGNEIRVFIMDEGEFENYRNGNNFRPQYQTEKVNGGEINLRLYSGRYVIVFDNTFSRYSNKTITSNLQIEYE